MEEIFRFRVSLWASIGDTSRTCGKGTYVIEDSPKSQLKISVRNLVAYTCRSGDLDLTSFGSSNPVDAIRAHQQIQKSRPDDYQSEVPVSIRVKIDDFILDVGGRIDGVLNTPQSVLIEEIKTTTKDLSLTAQSHNELHWGQLKCYAFIYAQDQKLQTIETRLTYFHLETRKTEEVSMTFRIEELRAFFERLIARFLGWIEQVQSYIRIRDESIRSLKFPFDSRRSGQDIMMEAVETSIVENQQLLIQAATGIGKTMAIVFPAIKSIPQRQAAKVFYLTARTTGKSAAEDAFDLLKTKDLRLKTLTLTAQDKICFNPDALCSAKECQYAEGYYDRINDALTDARIIFGERRSSHFVLNIGFVPFNSHWS